MVVGRGAPWSLGERTALVEPGTILGPVVRGEQPERTDDGGDRECESNEHVLSIGACVPLL